MFYRRAGIRHTRYQDERQLFPLPFDRFLILAVLVALATAPLLLDRFYLAGYLLPWLIWSTAALGLNLLMGGAGQIHLGYGAVMAIGAYGSVHMVRAGVPLEIAMIVGGLLSASIGVVFGAAALRVKGIYLAMATLAMQYIVDFVIAQSHYSNQTRFRASSAITFFCWRTYFPLWPIITFCRQSTGLDTRFSISNGEVCPTRDKS